jgi:steroid 5-alpha reductase family enzyme
VSENRTRAFAWIVAAYVVAAAVAVAVGYAGYAMTGQHVIAIALAADVMATVTVFAFSYAFDNSSFYDAYWSVAPIAIALFWTLTAAGDAVVARQALVIALVAIWGARLTYNWARSWTGLDHEDWRYVDLRKKSGKLAWLVSFTGIHMMPTLWVFGGCLSLYPALTVGARPLGVLDAVAVLVTAGAIWIEARADKELRRFRTSAHDRQEILASGVWGYSRHPNYFGEMSFWWGLYLFGLAADPAYSWTILGPLAITLMFRFVSLPMIETRMSERRPGFAAHAQRVSMVVPWPPRGQLGSARR